MSNIKVEKKEHLGWKNCVSISNDTVEAIITTDVGPRIIYYGYKGGFNHMKVFPEQAGTTGGEGWKIYGGHRLWHSPELLPRTYEVENSPVKFSICEDGAAFYNEADAISGMKKEFRVRMDESGTGLRIEHKITNENAWDVEFALWALTVAAPGGRLVIPQPGVGPKLLPNRNITFWTYTRLDDPRVRWLDRYIFLDQDVNARYTDEEEHRRFEDVPFKIGLHVPDGWVAYINNGEAFVKYFQSIPGEVYPDFGHCSFETYTNIHMLEIESLSPLRKIGPGKSMSHEEKWKLYSDIKKPETQKEADEIAVIVNA